MNLLDRVDEGRLSGGIDTYMKPETLEAKLLKMESFDAEVDADVMEKEILPRQREINDAMAQAGIENGLSRRSVERQRRRYDEEQLALIGKAKSLRGKRVLVSVEEGKVIDLRPVTKKKKGDT